MSPPDQLNYRKGRLYMPNMPTSTNTAHADQECRGIREVLNRVGDKWSLLVVGVLAEQPRRFGDLRRNVDGISQRMLTRTLRLLERDGIVKRTVFVTVPPGVEYELSALGKTLTTPVRALAEWARQHMGTIQAAQLHFDSSEDASPPEMERENCAISNPTSMPLENGRTMLQAN